MRQVAVVTGASKGIGAATAIAFAEAGYDLVINYLNDSKAAKTVQSQVQSAGREGLLMQADVSTSAGVEKLFSEVEKKFGHVDVLVNNAGAAKEASFGEWTQTDIVKSLNTNFASAAMCTQAVIPLMEKGSILFTSSIYGLQFGGSPRLILYSAGKAAMINFAQVMAEKLAPEIRCNIVAPGTTKTPAWDTASSDYVDTSLGMTLQREWVGSSEIADAFVFLAKTPHINAQTIVVDAGWQKKIRPNPK